MPVNYSVLMSVYYKEHPDYLRQSMQSIYDQTVPTDDFVLVCDGLRRNWMPSSPTCSSNSGRA